VEIELDIEETAALKKLVAAFNVLDDVACGWVSPVTRGLLASLAYGRACCRR